MSDYSRSSAKIIANAVKVGQNAALSEIFDIPEKRLILVHSKWIDKRMQALKAIQEFMGMPKWSNSDCMHRPYTNAGNVNECDIPLSVK